MLITLSSHAIDLLSDNCPKQFLNDIIGKTFTESYSKYLKNHSWQRPIAAACALPKAHRTICSGRGQSPRGCPCQVTNAILVFQGGRNLSRLAKSGEIRIRSKTSSIFISDQLIQLIQVDITLVYIGHIMVKTSINIVCFPFGLLVWCRLPLCGTTTCHAPAALRHLAKCHQQPTSGHTKDMRSALCKDSDRMQLANTSLTVLQLFVSGLWQRNVNQEQVLRCSMSQWTQWNSMKTWPKNYQKT